MKLNNWVAVLSDNSIRLHRTERNNRCCKWRIVSVDGGSPSKQSAIILSAVVTPPFPSRIRDVSLRELGQRERVVPRATCGCGRWLEPWLGAVLESQVRETS